MGFLSTEIEKIEELIAEDTPASLTYAALECRLSVERFCYERLRTAHDYISHEDLSKWQPKDVVKTLIAEVFEYAASNLKLSISITPTVSGKEYEKEDYEAHTYEEVGHQTAFDPNRLGKVWNSLSSFLHVRMPKNKLDVTGTYGNIDKLRAKLKEAVAELKELDKGNILISGFGEEISFECKCGAVNKRRGSLLSEGKTISCINSECDEKFTVSVEDGEFYFKRQTIEIPCKGCGSSVSVARGSLLKMKYDQIAGMTCECSHRIRVKWDIRLVEE